MINNDIVIFSLSRFDDSIESTSLFLARELAKTNRVYLVENPFTYKDYLVYRGKKQQTRRQPYYKDKTKIMRTDNPNLSFIIPPVLPSIHFLPEGKAYRKLLKLNEKIFRNRLKKIFKHHKIENFIFINMFNFHFTGLMDGLKPALNIYYSLDPLVKAFDLKHGKTSEEILLKKSDMVISSTQKLLEENKKYNEHVYLLPNAADINHSAKARSTSLKVSDKVSGFKKPVIGYFGNIERRFDFNMLREVAAMNEDKDFVFVGPVGTKYIPSWFFEIQNVHLTGPVSYDEMPAVVKGFDVTMIPFKKDEVSETIFPLKLFEYLGAGKPVVATDFNPFLRRFTGDTVSYCSNAATFSAAINTILSTDTEEDKVKRIATAEQNTWSNRCTAFFSILSSHKYKETVTVIRNNRKMMPIADMNEYTAAPVV